MLKKNVYLVLILLACLTGCQAGKPDRFEAGADRKSAAVNERPREHNLTKSLALLVLAMAGAGYESPYD